jgi:hypothetical protein
MSVRLDWIQYDTSMKEGQQIADQQLIALWKRSDQVLNRQVALVWISKLYTNATAHRGDTEVSFDDYMSCNQMFASVHTDGLHVIGIQRVR